MRRAVELVVKQLLRSRVGLALLLAVVVVAILGSTRLVLGGGGQSPTVGAGARGPATTVDGHEGDDGLISPKPAPKPVTSPGAAEPLTVARAFATAWLHHHDVTAREWHDALAPHATEGLAERLDGADPAGVPAERITGEPELIPHAAAFVEVAVPVDSGRLVLRLVAPDGRWLVDGVDWGRE